MTKTLFIILLSGMLLLASGARADDNLKGVKLLCNYELYTRAVEPGRNAWTIYSPDGLEFVDRKNLILYTIAPGIDNFNLRSEKREYLALNSSIEIKKKILEMPNIILIEPIYIRLILLEGQSPNLHV